MAEKVIMPKAGMAMEEGKIIKWLKLENEKVEIGEPLFEIETDKVNMEIEATATGYLIKVLNEEGDVVPVTQTIAYIGEQGEKVEEETTLMGKKGIDEQVTKEINTKSFNKLGSIGNRVAATPLAKTLASEKDIDISNVKGSGVYGEIRARDIENIDGILATPLAKKIAQEHNLDLANVKNKQGKRIRKDDVLQFINGNVKEEENDIVNEKDTREPIKGMRKVIADRMLQSYLQSPMVTLNSKADVTELSSLRKKINNLQDIKISFNDFILKACSIALTESPNINVSIDGNEIIYKKDINIGMAVSVNGGLIVPVIKNIDSLSLKNISSKAKDFALKAREGKLLPNEYTGGTFTVSNLGMYGIISFNPIINPPESAILGVGSIEDTLVMEAGEIQSRSILGLSLTFDHRVIDGAEAAIFLRRISKLLENPFNMLI